MLPGMSQRRLERQNKLSELKPASQTYQAEVNSVDPDAAAAAADNKHTPGGWGGARPAAIRNFRKGGKL